MIRFFARRLVSTVLVLVGVSVLVFLLVQLVPGDPARAALGMAATEEQVAQVRQEMGLDEPVYVQYFAWAGDVLRGDLGQSLALSQPVSSILFPKLLNTIILACGSLAIAVVAGVSLGMLAGTRQYSGTDRGAMFVALFGASVPIYWLAIVFVGVFALNLGLLPSSGIYDVRDPGGFLDLLRHLIMPAVATAMVSTAVIARLTRSTVVETLQQDFVKTLRASGIPERRIVWRHVFRNILPPLTNITGLQVGYLLGGVIFAEVVFNWPGLGLQLYTAITARDFPMIQAGVLFIALVFVLVNLLTDFVVALLDPRVRKA